MTPTPPRRPSRARNSAQPTPTMPPTHSTSSSSVSSTRTERATRSNHKQTSPQKSSTPHSLSSEDAEAHADPPQTRRRTREQDHDDEDNTKLEDDLEDDIAEEEEITRCVCGQQEYPGLPSDVVKSRGAQSSSMADSEAQNDDAGGLFIQCDICKVWQHGGCVGIMDEAASPDEYFCEECRKDLHKVTISSKGQRFSRYLPIYEPANHKNTRKSSVSKESDGKASRDKDRLSRASVESFSKRRSTMNSRAAYDEDEVLRKVLEESKHERAVPQSENGSRKKRGRDESEEIKPDVKRQRTSSRSPSNSPAVESEDEHAKSAKQKPRGAAARSQREKELRDKEKERERAEAASRRGKRAERRKAEDIEAMEQTPAEDPPTVASASESILPDTPNADPKPVPAPRKSGRPPAQKRQGRLGRNQYTKDVPTPATNGTSPAPNNDAPNSPQISITNGVTNGHESSDGATGVKNGKSKNWRLEKLSWTDIRRPASAMQNYITQRQVEMAVEKKSPVSAVPSPSTNGDQGQEKDEKEEAGEAPPGEEAEMAFKKMSTLQMMDELNRDLIHWQHMISGK
ncbi:hypothetical protein EJ04DRAFT_477542 [Polyplosphaeria fusca]|uniref:Zinc finger PHD-type domain-containing protein n=1 Tax=Polyplosphaeria fusca TaxID=682080 RepID=A0A9P4QNS7_9PLEO|nr:hypothetical protein EJ04DRAFT_477542 [Polyplosphaeria fusca]